MLRFRKCEDIITYHCKHFAVDVCMAIILTIGSWTNAIENTMARQDEVVNILNTNPMWFVMQQFHVPWSFNDSIVDQLNLWGLAWSGQFDVTQSVLSFPDVNHNWVYVVMACFRPGLGQSLHYIENKFIISQK